jgi:AraC-like DNA-binding protein
LPKSSTFVINNDVLALRTFFLEALLEEMRARGLDPAVLASRSGVEEVATLSAVAEEIAALSGEPSLGVRIAERTTLRLEAPSAEPAPAPPADGAALTLGDALARLATATGQGDARARFTFEAGEPGGVLALHVAGAAQGLGRQGNEHALVAAVQWARALTGRVVSPRRAWLAHSENEASAVLRAALGCADVAFGAGASGLVFDADTLALPLVADLPALSPATQLDLVAELRARLRPTLLGGAPGVGALARALAMSTRTLQRRLGELGTSYGDVLDDLRRDVARLRLERRDLTVAAAARELGYSDSRAFIRAFRRWTGATPGAYQVRA